MTSYRFAGRDSVTLACCEAGCGRPVILLHGFTGSGSQMLEHGQARGLAELGYRVIAPDLRGHGHSAKPHDRAAYPPDVLADDGLALVEHLGFSAGRYDLGGYSLGARIVVRMLVRDARFVRVLGDHGSAFAAPEVTAAVASFLAARSGKSAG